MNHFLTFYYSSGERLGFESRSDFEIFSLLLGQANFTQFPVMLALTTEQLYWSPRHRILKLNWDIIYIWVFWGLILKEQARDLSVWLEAAAMYMASRGIWLFWPKSVYRLVLKNNVKHMPLSELSLCYSNSLPGAMNLNQGRHISV